MTESKRETAERQQSEGPARSVLDYEPAPDVAYPVRAIAGLALPGPLHSGHLATASAAAPSISVVDALRRQAIRRSSAAASMNLGNDHDHDEDHDDDSEMEEEEDDGWDGDDAGRDLVRWLGKKAGSGTNYTVAVCSGDIYISKVGGVTKEDGVIKQLEPYIKEQGIERGRDIFLCRRFSKLPSNHAEMCVLAAIGAKKLANITYFACTSPSCDYCAETLKHYGVSNSSRTDEEPASQTGWAHPFKAAAFGTQLGGTHAELVEELKAYLANDKVKLKYGKSNTTDKPSSGQCDEWL